MNSFSSFQDHEVRKWTERTERGMAATENTSRLVKQGEKIWEAIPSLSNPSSLAAFGQPFQRLVSNFLDLAAPQPGRWPNTDLGYEGTKTDVDREHTKRLKWLGGLFQDLEQASGNTHWRSWLGFQKSADNPLWKGSKNSLVEARVTERRLDWLLEHTDGHRKYTPLGNNLMILNGRASHEQKIRFLKEYPAEDWIGENTNRMLAAHVLKLWNYGLGLKNAEETLAVLDELPTQWDELTVQIVSHIRLDSDSPKDAFESFCLSLCPRLSEEFFRKDKVLDGVERSDQYAQECAIFFHDLSTAWKQRAMLRERVRPVIKNSVHVLDAL